MNGSARGSASTRMLIGIGVSAVCLFVAFRRVDFAMLRAALKAADYRWLLLFPLLSVALNVLRGRVWRLLLKGKADLAPAFWAYTVGFLFNNVMPFRVGEAARVVVLATHERLPTAEVAATAIVERILDLICVLVVLACTLPTVGFGESALKYGALAAASAVALSLASIVVLAVYGTHLEKPIARVALIAGPGFRDSVVRHYHQAAEGASRLLTPSIGIPAAIQVLLVWVLMVLGQWAVLRAFQPEATLVQAAFMEAVVSLAIAVPAAPGFIGVYQWAGQQALVHAFASMYTPASGLAVAVVSHAVSYVCSSLLGIMGFWYFGTSFSLAARLRTEPELQEVESA